MPEPRDDLSVLPMAERHERLGGVPRRIPGEYPQPRTPMQLAAQKDDQGNEEDWTKCTVYQPFSIKLTNGIEVPFPVGTYDVPQSLTRHWYFSSNYAVVGEPQPPEERPLYEPPASALYHPDSQELYKEREPTEADRQAQEAAETAHRQAMRAGPPMPRTGGVPVAMPLSYPSPETGQRMPIGERIGAGRVQQLGNMPDQPGAFPTHPASPGQPSNPPASVSPRGSVPGADEATRAMPENTGDQQNQPRPGGPVISGAGTGGGPPLGPGMTADKPAGAEAPNPASKDPNEGAGGISNKPSGDKSNQNR